MPRQVCVYAGLARIVTGLNNPCESSFGDNCVLIKEEKRSYKDCALDTKCNYMKDVRDNYMKCKHEQVMQARAGNASVLRSGCRGCMLLQIVLSESASRKETLTLRCFQLHEHIFGRDTGSGNCDSS